MSIQVVSRWNIPHETAQRIIRDAAPTFRNNGATSVRLGRVTTGIAANQTVIVITYPDFETMGKALNALQQDAGYQQKYNEALQAGQMLSRNIIVSDEIE